MKDSKIFSNIKKKRTEHEVLCPLGLKTGSASVFLRNENEALRIESERLASVVAVHLLNRKSGFTEHLDELDDGVHAEWKRKFFALPVHINPRPFLVVASGRMVKLCFGENNGAVGEFCPVIGSVVANNPVSIDDIEHELAAALQRSCNRVESLLIFVITFQVAERGKEIKCDIELVLEWKLAHISFVPTHRNSGLCGGFLCFFDEEAIEILSGYIVAATRQLNGVAAMPARAVQNLHAFLEREHFLEEIYLRQSFLLRKHGLVLFEITGAKESVFLAVPRGLRCLFLRHSVSPFILPVVKELDQIKISSAFIWPRKFSTLVWVEFHLRRKIIENFLGEIIAIANANNHRHDGLRRNTDKFSIIFIHKYPLNSAIFRLNSIKNSIPNILSEVNSAATEMVGKFEKSFIMVRDRGIEPLPNAWEALVLPLN